MLAISRDSTSVLLVDLGTGNRLATLESLFPLKAALAFQPDGDRLHAAATDGRNCEWDLPLLRRELGNLGLDWQDPRP